MSISVILQDIERMFGLESDVIIPGFLPPECKSTINRENRHTDPRGQLTVPGKIGTTAVSTAATLNSYFQCRKQT
jgi:hypothetical protein